MSVVIAIKVSEGVVLAADSAATLTGTILDTDGTTKKGVIQTFYNAKKLLQIGDFPIGILTWGVAGIGARTVESHIREWEYQNHWQSDKILRANKPTEFKLQVKECADGLFAHIKDLCASEFGKDEKNIPSLGILIAGYSEGKFFPEMWRFQLPFDKVASNQRPDMDGKPDFGATWFGAVDALVRLHWGRDDRAITKLAEKFGVPPDEIREDLNFLQYSIPFAQMPIQDAVDYAKHMVDVAIGRYRFVAGAPLCGGAVDVAAVTQNNFHWISQKSYTKGDL